MQINVTRGTGFSSFLTPGSPGKEESQQRSAVERVEVVEARRLDSLFMECLRPVPDPRVFLTMDMGYDLDAPEGAGIYPADVLALQTELPVRPS
ncbi:MAG: hypothetical protein ACHQ7N_16040 [Candidatus Methylomirabilales bacterium]